MSDQFIAAAENPLALLSEASFECFREIALLDDAQAELCLNGILKGLSDADPNTKQLIQLPHEMTAVLSSCAAEFQLRTKVIGEPTPRNRPGAVRLILVELASAPDSVQRVNGWFKASRPVLLEPVTSALVLAGIIAVLSTRFKASYKGGKLELELEKKAATEQLLKKLFTFFH